jgi:pimeloyl-ACP methyl ester carboxylesterase
MAAWMRSGTVACCHARVARAAQTAQTALVRLVAVLLAITLAACGGGSGGSDAGTGTAGEGGAGGPGGGVPVAPAPIDVPEPVGPGRTLAVEPGLVVPAGAVRDALVAQCADAPPLVATYDVATYRLTYLTLDAEGREQRASGLMAVPAKPAGARSPVLSWQHGTLFRDAEAPSNSLAPGELPIQLAAAGYFVVAADYVGYGVSKGVPHPYLLSAPTASAVLDLLVAARNWRLRQGVAGNGQLFLAGYSEGGFATVAAHRALQAGPHAAGSNLAVQLGELVAVVPGAGPYHLAATLDALLEQIRDESPLLAALIDPGFLRHLGSSVRNEVRRRLVRYLIPGDADVAFDTRFVDAYLEDDRDKIERQSNVHDWKPLAPVRLFHGRDDRVVPYASSTSTLATMLNRGAADVTLADCTAAPAGHLECVAGYKRHVVQMLAPWVRDL